jgi:hypothetical protein
MHNCQLIHCHTGLHTPQYETHAQKTLDMRSCPGCCILWETHVGDKSPAHHGHALSALMLMQRVHDGLHVRAPPALAARSTRSTRVTGPAAKGLQGGGGAQRPTAQCSGARRVGGAPPWHCGKKPARVERLGLGLG